MWCWRKSSSSKPTSLSLQSELWPGLICNTCTAETTVRWIRQSHLVGWNWVMFGNHFSLTASVGALNVIAVLPPSLWHTCHYWWGYIHSGLTPKLFIFNGFSVLIKTLMGIDITSNMLWWVTLFWLMVVGVKFAVVKSYVWTRKL